MLSGRLTSPDDFAPGDLRRDFPRFQGENFARNLAVVEQLKRLADEQRAAPSQLAIAWLLAQGEDIVPIPGAERRRYLEENVRTLEVRLTRRTWPLSSRWLRAGWLPGNAMGQRGWPT